jgi:hypothetical protein
MNASRDRRRLPWAAVVRHLTLAGARHVSRVGSPGPLLSWLLLPLYCRSAVLLLLLLLLLLLPPPAACLVGSRYRCNPIQSHPIPSNPIQSPPSRPRAGPATQHGPRPTPTAPTAPTEAAAQPLQISNVPTVRETRKRIDCNITTASACCLHVPSPDHRAPPSLPPTLPPLPHTPCVPPVVPIAPEPSPCMCMPMPPMPVPVPMASRAAVRCRCRCSSGVGGGDSGSLAPDPLRNQAPRPHAHVREESENCPPSARAIGCRPRRQTSPVVARCRHHTAATIDVHRLQPIVSRVPPSPSPSPSPSALTVTPTYLPTPPRPKMTTLAQPAGTTRPTHSGLECRLPTLWLSCCVLRQHTAKH